MKGTNCWKYETLLSLDGGGIRGLISSMVLRKIEQLLSKKKSETQHIGEYFDLIAATSTGGILATGLAKPKNPLTADELVKLYTKQGNEIFDPSRYRRQKYWLLRILRGANYDAGPLEKILTERLDDTELKDTCPDVIVTSYDIEKRKPYFFKTSNARTEDCRNHLLRHVARATSAAPTFFEPLLLDEKQWHGERKRRVLIDGGVFASNPSMVALSEALSFAKDADDRRELCSKILLCSIGVGTNNEVFPYKKAKKWGWIGWGKRFPSVVLDGMSDSADYHAQQILDDSRYFRFDIPLCEASDDVDDASPGNIAKLKSRASDLIEEKACDLNRLVDLLIKRSQR